MPIEIINVYNEQDLYATLMKIEDGTITVPDYVEEKTELTSPKKKTGRKSRSSRKSKKHRKSKRSKSSRKNRKSKKRKSKGPSSKGSQKSGKASRKPKRNSSKKTGSEPSRTTNESSVPKLDEDKNQASATTMASRHPATENESLQKSIKKTKSKKSSRSKSSKKGNPRKKSKKNLSKSSKSKKRNSKRGSKKRKKSKASKKGKKMVKAEDDLPWWMGREQKLQVYVFFTSMTDERGRVLDELSSKVEEVLNVFIRWRLPPRRKYIIIVVRLLEFMYGLGSFLNQDPLFRVFDIPLLVRWRGPQRLSKSHCLEEKLLHLFFEYDDKNPTKFVADTDSFLGTLLALPGTEVQKLASTPKVKGKSGRSSRKKSGKSSERASKRGKPSSKKKMNKNSSKKSHKSSKKSKKSIKKKKK